MSYKIPNALGICTYVYIMRCFLVARTWDFHILLLHVFMAYTIGHRGH